MKTGPKMARYESRQRAVEAYELRIAHYSWKEVADRLGFASVGAAQQAVNAHIARIGREPTETARSTREDSIRLRSRVLNTRLVQAFRDGNDDALVMLNRELTRNDSELAKLQGLYAPAKVEVAVTSMESIRQRLLTQLERPAIDAEVVEEEVTDSGLDHPNNRTTDPIPKKEEKF